MDAVFKALADPTRRQLLDALRDKGGLTLTELEAGLGMTRFGVMKHLKVLEAAGLVTTHKAGRFKHHYLNAAPIQELADRWIAPYQKPFARFAIDLKTMLETPKIMADKPDFVLVTYIRTTTRELWDALVNPDFTAQYYFGTRVETDLVAGGPFRYRADDGSVMLDGEIVEVVPLKKIVSTFIPSWAQDSQPTRVTFELEPVGEAVKFTITHHDYEKANAGIDDGWPKIAAALKTLLETGRPMQLPAM